MTYKFKEKVKADLDRQNSERQEYQKNLFNQKYNKLKEYEFPKTDNINMNIFFCFPKFEAPFLMSLPSIAIYPILCLQSNFEDNKWFQISQNKIAKMAGLSPNTVSKGIMKLENINFRDQPLLEKQRQIHKTRRFYIYRVHYIRTNEMKSGNYFIFHKCIVDSGIWAELHLRAKALYISMRMNSYFVSDLYYELEEDFIYEGLQLHEFIHSNDFRNRKWDVCNKSLVDLCNNVGIKPINLKPVLRQLEYHGLIERVDENKSIFKVYLKPKIPRTNRI